MDPLGMVEPRKADCAANAKDVTIGMAATGAGLAG